MSKCQHLWEMSDVWFGFIVFEKCNHCNSLRTYFSERDHPTVGDEYREGDCIWRCMENAQSLKFNLQCSRCGQVEKFHDLMGFLYCTSCLPRCKVEIRQKKYEPQNKWVIVAFGFFPRQKPSTLTRKRLNILQKYFNQRRDTSRSTIAILSYDLIEDFSVCKGEFIHDIGMLSTEPPPKERKPLF